MGQALRRMKGHTSVSESDGQGVGRLGRVGLRLSYGQRGMSGFSGMAATWWSNRGRETSLQPSV